MKPLCLLLILLTTACDLATFSPHPVATRAVTVTVFKYSPEFQAKAAHELEAIDGALGYHRPAQAPPCSRQIPSKDCSAVRAMMPDYKYDRDQARRLGAVEVP